MIDRDKTDTSTSNTFYCIIFFIVGYLNTFCQTLLDELDKIPSDSRTQIGFLCYDCALYFFNLEENLSQPQMLIVSDVDGLYNYQTALLRKKKRLLDSSGISSTSVLKVTTYRCASIS